MKEWIQLADEATYQAKREGRNRVVLATSHASAAVANKSKGKTVLIADSQDVTRSLVRNHLESLGFRCFETETGKMTYDVLQREDVSLVIVDVDLPEWAGLDVLAFLKKDPHFKSRDIPVVLLADRRSQDSVIQATMLGVDDFFVRPFSPVLLGNAIQRLLETNR